MNILLCTLGTSWAVIPEIYGFLAPDALPLYRHHPEAEVLEGLRQEHGLLAPDEIWVCTTEGDKTASGLNKLRTWYGLLARGPLLRIWQAAGTGDLASQAECRHLRELLLRATLLAHHQAGGGQVVLSLAGGRKTMSADLQWAGMVFGCHALLHVVGKEPLPDALNAAQPETFTTALPADMCPAVLPLVAGRGTRSELLDVEMDGRGRVDCSEFPLPLAPVTAPLSWSEPAGRWLENELRERERAGSQLLGNYLHSLSAAERHENWRSLYRLPPRLIQHLRDTQLTAEHADWLDRLPKADLHRHVGGCLNLSAQRAVGRAIWEALMQREKDQALAAVRPLLDCSDWDWDWPERLRGQTAAPRAHCAAGLLVEADDLQLRHNLFDITEPRLALKERHEHGFAAYERPGELSGSAILSHPAAIKPYARAVVAQAVAEGLAYVELRGSPQKYGDGMAFLHAFHTALEAAGRELAGNGAALTPQFRFILIADRRDRAGISGVVDLAVAARGRWPEFIAGLDLAGDEGTAQPETLAPDFLSAFESCLPLTIHAGEGEDAGKIWQAAYHLHADRIGHGLSIHQHPELAARFRDRGICLELCPTSNREVVGFRHPAYPDTAKLRDYPLGQLWRQGLPLTICTDNPGISRTTLADEYLAAARMTPEGISLWDCLAMIRQAFVHAFLPRDRRDVLLHRVDHAVFRLVSEDTNF